VLGHLGDGLLRLGSGGLGVGEQFVGGVLTGGDDGDDRAEQEAAQQPQQDQDVDGLQNQSGPIEMHQWTKGLANSSSRAMTRQ
jgi:hypothetical protein